MIAIRLVIFIVCLLSFSWFESGYVQQILAYSLEENRITEADSTKLKVVNIIFLYLFSNLTTVFMLSRLIKIKGGFQNDSKSF